MCGNFCFFKFAKFGLFQIPSIWGRNRSGFLIYLMKQAEDLEDKCPDMDIRRLMKQFVDLGDRWPDMDLRACFIRHITISIDSHVSQPMFRLFIIWMQSPSEIMSCLLQYWDSRRTWRLRSRKAPSPS